MHSEEQSGYNYAGVIAKIIINLVNPALKDSPQREWYFQSQTYLAPFITGNDLANLAIRSVEQKYPWAYVKKIVDLHVDLNQYWPCISYAQLQELYPCDTLSDNGAISILCEKVLGEDPKAVADYKKGKLAALNHLKGKVMKESKGKADIKIVETILKEKMI